LPVQKSQYLRIEIPPESIKRGSNYLSQSNGYFQESDKKILIKLAFPSEVYFEVVITKLADPLTLNNCVLHQSGDKGNYWKLQVPFGRFSGILTTLDDKYSLRGMVYHDHQWGNIPIQDFVSDWVWGHFSSELGSATFYAIQTQRGELIERYAVVTPQGIQTSLDQGETPHLRELVQNDFLNLWQNEPVIVFPFGATLKTKIGPNEILRSRINESHIGFFATYLRWLGNAQLSLVNGSLQGVTAYLRIRKEV